MKLAQRPLSVAVFSDSVLPVLNGVSVSIDSLVRCLREGGHSVHVYTSRYPRHRDSDPNVRRFLSVRSPWTGDYPLAVPPFYAWFREFAQQGFDIVHTHTPFTVGMVGLRWAESLGIPIVSTYHTRYDKYDHYVPFFPRQYVRYKIAKHTCFYYQSVAHVVTPSQATLRWLRAHSVQTPASVIPTGVPRPRAVDRGRAREERGVHDGHVVMVCCSRVAIEKNLDLVLGAAKSAMDDVPNLRLWVVGGGPALQHYSGMARSLGIGDRVRFWGAVPRAEVDEFYAAGDMFVFGSTTETQGLVVSEAMSHGLPVVVAAGGGASSAVVEGETGFVVPNEPEAMASVVRLLARDAALRRTMAESCRAAAAELSVEAMARRVVGVYRTALGESQAGRSVAEVV